MRTFVYVDGFDLSCAALKGTPFKRLDPITLLKRILQAHHDIVNFAVLRGGGTCGGR